MREIVIEPDEAGQRLNKFIMKYLNKAPSSFVYKMLRKKNIKLNGCRADGSEMVREGDRVQLYLSDETIDSFCEKKTADSKPHTCHMKPDIVYHDDNIMIVNKPAGVLSQKADKNDYSINECVIDYLVESGFITDRQLRSFRPSVCNRLDRNTSGLVLCGVSLMGSQELSHIIRERRIDKYYYTIVSGELKEGLLKTGYLLKDERSNTVTVMPGIAEFREKFGDAAYEKVEAEFIPIRTCDGFTELKVSLITGKSHQIRAQLKAMGYPVLGDTKYGDRKVNTYFRQSFGLKHQLLHCGEVAFEESWGGLSYLCGRSFEAGRPELYERIEESIFGAGR